ncbi:hypothetical protein JOD01_003517 [Brevibacillus fulvus]|uniref:Uncharacterized protein n=1 Tax=Brevibacillus fulvus TaxID=1125967 RepID=A0A938Y5Z4_9BACL|nr:hypothetical protein [Brevibacillus fulvus]
MTSEALCGRPFFLLHKDFLNSKSNELPDSEYRSLNMLLLFINSFPRRTGFGTAFKVSTLSR